MNLLYRNKDLLLLTDDKYFDLMQCAECSLVFLDPQPSYDDLKKYYPDSYEPYANKKILFLIERVLRLKGYFFAKKLKKIKGHDARILEIGCANGENLLELKSFGFNNLEGVEPSQSASDRALEKGLAVHYGSFESIKTNRKYDIIVMRHVIEHLKNPNSVFYKLSELLNEGGYIFIETPNHASLDRFILGKYWLGYDTPRHLYVYSPSNLRKLLKNFNFRIVGIHHSIVPNNWVESFKLYFNDTNQKKLARFFSIYNIFLLMVFTPLNIIQALFSFSGRIRIVLQKK